MTALALVALAVWGIGAIAYRAPLPPAGKTVLAAVFAAAFLFAAYAVLANRRRRRAMAVAGLATAGLMLWYRTITPSDSLDWAPDMDRRSLVTIRGGDVTIENLRNFAWRGEYDGTPSWETRGLKLSDLETVDLFLSYWTGPNIAHMLMSFGTGDGRYFTFSTEIRRRKGQEYDPLAGFFRSYTQNVVVADEADIIKVRTNFRGEDVYRYRLDIRPETARRLFGYYAQLTQDLAKAPQFYNTILDNCTTGPYAMLRAHDPAALPLDWRILVVGRLPEFLFEQKLIDTSRPLADVARAARVTEQAKSAAALTGAAFSAAIRAP